MDRQYTGARVPENNNRAAISIMEIHIKPINLQHKFNGLSISDNSNRLH